MTVVKKSISLSPEVLAQIEKFVSRHPGTTERSTKIAEIISDFAAELNRAKKEIDGIFTKSEWNYLRDAFNGTIITPDFHPVSTLKMQVEDAQEYDGLDKKWNVDVPAFLEKIKKLTSFQGYAVLKTVDEWWQKEKDK